MNKHFFDGVVFSKYHDLMQGYIQIGNIKLYQIAENILERGSEMFEHHQICNGITYVVSGEADFYVNGECHHLSKGYIQIIPKGSKHKIVVNSTSRFRYFYLGFDIITNNEQSQFDKLANLYSDKSKTLIDDGTILLYFSRFINELSISDEFNHDMYYSFTMLIIIHLYRIFTKDGNISRHDNTTSNDMSGTVFGIIKYIDNNIRTVKKVSDIADKMNYSLSYISRIFKQKMGITISEYISQKKIEIAVELLKHERLSINEVRELLNYDTYGSFLKSFKKYMGCSPSEFIKQLR